jgi:hypothetical protein
MNKKTYLFIIVLLSTALCVSVTFNLSGKTEASAAKVAPLKKAKAAKLRSDIIDDINSEFNGTIFHVVAYDNGRLTVFMRKDIGGGIYDNKILYVDDVDIENDVSFE